MLLSAKWPNIVEHVNNNFTSDFGVPAENIVGYPFQAISPCALDTDLWYALINSSLEGCRNRETNSIRTASGDKRR